MNITLSNRVEQRFLDAIKQREDLLNTWAHQHPSDWEERLAAANQTIASAVATSMKVNRKMSYGQKYEALSRGY